VSDVSGLIWFAPLVLLLLWLFTRTRTQQREFAATQAAIEPGRRVMMTSGVYGEIVSVDGDTLVLEVSPGVHTTWMRQAVARVIPADDGETDSSHTTDDDAAGPA
jgi:preprotein translocase subunit YajC